MEPLPHASTLDRSAYGKETRSLIVLLGLLLLSVVLPATRLNAQANGNSLTDSASPKVRVRIGLKALMQKYDTERGLWDTEGWWNAANSTTVLGDAAVLDPVAVPIATFRNTLSKSQQKFPNFLNEYYDDEGWWALAWIQAFDVTHDGAYLKMAQSIFMDMAGGWDDVCGGGIWWRKDRHYKNAIANELFLSVAAHLATRTTGGKRRAYLAWAKREWDWFDASGMINDKSLVNDGLTPACKNNERTAWSYNQGVIIGGLAELSQATGDAAPLRKAQSIAHAALSHLTDADLILHDPTEPHCSEDTVQFKGIFVRNLLRLQKSAPAEEYVKFIQANADSIWKKARSETNEFSCSWSGPSESRGAGATTSALDALVAAASVN